MKIISLAALILGMLLSASCLTSLQPLVTYDTVTEENRIIGNWQHENAVYKVEKLTQSSIYNEIVDGIKTRDDPENKKPLSEKEKKDSILYSHAYTVSWQKDGITYYMFASMTRINKGLFMELYPIVIDDPERQDGNGLDYTFDYVPNATFARVEIVDNNNVQLHFASGDVIKEQIDKGNIRIKHNGDEQFESFLITASTRDLRSFFEKYGHDQRLFGKENSLTLTRKG